MIPEEGVREYLENEFALIVKPGCSWQELEGLLSRRINDLIHHDFGRLVAILYRVDVNEKKLRYFLEQNAGEDAGALIARLILQRQQEKIRSREAYRKEKTDDGEEKW